MRGNDQQSAPNKSTRERKKNSYNRHPIFSAMMESTRATIILRSKTLNTNQKKKKKQKKNNNNKSTNQHL